MYYALEKKLGSVQCRIKGSCAPYICFEWDSMSTAGNRDDGMVRGTTPAWRSESLLGLLSPVARLALLACGRPRVFKPGDVLMARGDPPVTGLEVILSGKVKIVGSDKDGQVRVLAFREAGDVVGELGVLTGKPRTATVVAARRVETVMIRAHEFADLIRAYPEVQAAVAGTLAAKLQMATSRRLDFDGCPVIVRVAVRLLERASTDGWTAREGIIIRLTQPELAELVGASVPSVQKSLEQLRQPGIARALRRLRLGVEPVIAATRGRITILRRDALVKVAESG